MKRFLFLLTNFFIVIFLHAQTKPETQNAYDSLITGKKIPSQKFGWYDSIPNELRKKFFSETPPPGSLRKGFIYRGNNQNGFDIYQTMHDNMFILKPDSTFVSNMPILKLSLEQKPALEKKKN